MLLHIETFFVEETPRTLIFGLQRIQLAIKIFHSRRKLVLVSGHLRLLRRQLRSNFGSHRYRSCRSFMQLSLLLAKLLSNLHVALLLRETLVLQRQTRQAKRKQTKTPTAALPPSKQSKAT